MLIFQFGSLCVAIGDPRFNPGRLKVSPGVKTLEMQGRLFAALYLRRHLNTDWGDISEADRLFNDVSLCNDGRLASSYRIASDITLWIITEADRSVTTIRLPDES
ncbi:hypothetical protein I6I06_02405 [Paraburkholderia ginsengisoli]|uniref:Type I restriction endonuclease subunit M n=2 Tax=Paraburkholderia ginsengisoli TaxID=311231 RepID=A0A7T4N573_9BURK|nr:hypothetical protein I6I06_02405 [Paraburkholderia ginsengisoli]